MKNEELMRCEMGSEDREVTIERWAYDLVRIAVLQAIPADEQGIAVDELPDRAAEHLSPDDRMRLGAWRWYVTAVRLNMQAEGELERVPGVEPERVRRTA